MKFLLTLALALAVMASPALAAPMPMPDEPVAFASSLDEATYATSAGSYAVAASQPAEALACTTSGLSADTPSYLSSYTQPVAPMEPKEGRAEAGFTRRS